MICKKQRFNCYIVGVNCGLVVETTGIKVEENKIAF